MKKLTAVMLAFVLALCSFTAVYAVEMTDDDFTEVIEPVAAAPQSISLSAKSLLLGVGEAFTLKVIGAGGLETEWTSSDDGTASVSDGVVTAVGVGKTEITAKAGDMTCTCSVTVKEAPEEISLNYSKITLGVGETVDLDIIYSNDDCVRRSVYSSDKSDIAAVNKDNGVITANSVGTAVITATTFNGLTSKCFVTVEEAPEAISLNYDALCIGVGETVDLDIIYSSPNCVKKGYFSADSTNIASVNKYNGVIKAKNAGVMTVSAETYNGLKATCKITIMDAPDKVTLNSNSLTLGIGEEYTVIPYLSEGSASFGKIFKSSDTDVAEVDKNGMVTAKSAGNTVVSVTTHNGKTADCNISVKNAPQSIRLNTDEVSVDLDKKFDINIIYSDPDCIRKGYFSIDNNSIASVDPNNGIVTPKNPGTAVVTAYTYNGLSAQCKVTVVDQSESVWLNTSRTILGAGESYQLTAYFTKKTEESQLVFSSSNSSVASVDQYGNITADQAGTAKITAENYNEKTASCTVTVMPAPKSISLNKSEITILSGDKFDIDIIYSNPECIRKGYYSIDDPSVADVNAENGIVNAKAPGKAIVTASTYNGLSVSCVVNVVDINERISLNHSNVNVGVGESLDLDVIYNDPDSVKNTFYSSDSEQVVGVNKYNGIIKAKKTGNTVITATAHNGLTVSCKVTVMPAPSSVQLNKTVATVGVGEKIKLNNYIPSGSASFSRTYTCSNNKNAVVDNKGNVTALHTGTATVTVSTFNGKKSSCVLSVKKAPTAAYLTPGDMSVELGKTASIGVTFPSGEGTSYHVYSSADPKTASAVLVNGAVKIKGNALGETTVTYSTYNGVKTTCKIKVVKKLPKVTEAQLRQKVTDIINSWVGAKEGDKTHAEILRIYNSQKPLPVNYKMQTHDAWCAATVSAAWIKAGISEYTGTECGCGRFRDNSIKRGIWVENDAYKPKAGDAIIYCWDDNGIGDCKGSACHIGIVTAVKSDSFIVTEGNMGTGYVGKRTVKINGRYIRGFIAPNYEQIAKKLSIKY